MLLVVMTHLETLEIDSELLSTGSSGRTKGLTVTIRGKSGSAHLQISWRSSRGRRGKYSNISVLILEFGFGVLELREVSVRGIKVFEFISSICTIYIQLTANLRNSF